MKRIDDYVESISKNFSNRDEDINDIKDELKAHLYQTVEEHEASGISHEDSINKAISEFDSENNFEKEMSSVFKKETTFAFMLLKAAGFVLAIACLFFAISNLYNDKSGTKYVTSETVLSKICSEIEYTFKINPTSIDAILDDFNKENNNGLPKIIIKDVKSTLYSYDKNTIDSGNPTFSGSFKFKSYSISFSKTSTQQSIDIDRISKLIDHEKNPIKSSLRTISYYVFLIANILFCVALYYLTYLQSRNRFWLVFGFIDVVIGGFIILPLVMYPDYLKEFIIMDVATALSIAIAIKLYFMHKKINA